jgi:mono/diheme cytochrome c family protein
MTGAGMPAFGSIFKPGQIEAVVSYLRTLQGTSNSAPVSGDAEAGRTLFEGKGRCAQCHSMNGMGGFLASDLSGYGKTHSPDELRRQILNHKGIARIVTRRGRTYEGIMRNEDNFSLQLQSLNGDFLFVRKADLLTIEQRDGVTLDKGNLDDLISYLSR